MTTINNQQYAPQYRYEMPPTRPPVSSDDNTDAQANHNTSQDSARPRAPVGPEQRGQFSSHNKIVNQQPQNADSQGEIAELTRKNKNLLAKYNVLVEKFKAKLTEFNTKIENLTKQLGNSGNETADAPRAPDAQPQGRGAADQSVAPETPTTQNTQAQQSQETPKTEQSQSEGIDKLAAQITEMKDVFKNLLDQLNIAINTLTQKLEDLTQMISKGARQNQAPADQSDTTETASSNDVAPEQPAHPQSKESPTADESKAHAPGSIDHLKQENQKLEAQIAEIEQTFEQAMSKLQQQFETLTKQVSEQKQ